MTNDDTTKIDLIARQLKENQERLVRVEFALEGDERMEIPSLRQEMRDQMRQINERIDKIVKPIRTMFWTVLTAVIIAMTVSLVKSEDGSDRRYQQLEQKFFDLTHRVMYDKWHGTDSTINATDSPTTTKGVKK